ncbi:hypothetical protein ACUNV4_14655 [Granulosicoccus sp. 3-233]|uniref:hypothetical protein n=1 Tax=Granulosicoccus sp. 3-233 TaxID=3417969 RepID=UPI003D333290
MSQTARRRSVIVHYHLFKNAGTSVERLLQLSLGDTWASWDKPESGAKISGQELQQWLEANPRIRAVSSHQLVPPVPQGSFHVTPVVFLREPLSRVRSAWLFEWQKQQGLSEPKGSLTDYIEEKFKQKNTSVIANFQVSRLSNLAYDDVRQRLHRYNHDLLPAACGFIDSLPFVGLVDRFTESLQLMAECTRKRFPELIVKEHRENVTDASSTSIEQRIELLRREIGNDLFDELCVRNRLDLQLYSYASGRFAASLQRLEQRVGSAAARRLTLVR